MKIKKLKTLLKDNFNKEQNTWIEDVDNCETAKELLYLFSDYGYTFEDSIDNLLMLLVEE
jgi:hypothetical protein